MSIPFSQSLRALRQDSAGFGRWLAVAGALILGGWLLWFARADIPVYQRSAAVTVVSDTEAEALFSPGEGAQVSVGQDARLQLEDGRLAQGAVLPATVTAVTPITGEGAVRVQLALRPANAKGGPLAPGRTGSVEIRVAQLTPAQLFLRAAAGDR